VCGWGYNLLLFCGFLLYLVSYRPFHDYLVFSWFLRQISANGMVGISDLVFYRVGVFFMVKLLGGLYCLLTQALEYCATRNIAGKRRGLPHNLSWVNIPYCGIFFSMRKENRHIVSDRG